jgi:hypothetical protein
LDKEVPDWELRVDPDTLDLRSLYHCVLGQIFADDAWRSPTRDRKGRRLSGYKYALKTGVRPSRKAINPLLHLRQAESMWREEIRNRKLRGIRAHANLKHERIRPARDSVEVLA